MLDQDLQLEGQWPCHFNLCRPDSGSSRRHQRQLRSYRFDLYRTKAELHLRLARQKAVRHTRGKDSE